jgi:glycyl-tRNA synthetase beta chain
MCRAIGESATVLTEHVQSYREDLRRVADLAPVLDRFFDEVLVMAEDPEIRQNRIALLQSIGANVSRIARLTDLVVDKAEARAKSG